MTNPTADDAPDALSDGVRLLLYLAQVDNHYAAHEREVVKAYIHECAALAGRELPEEAALKEMLSARPTREAAIAGWKRILESGDDPHATLLLAKADNLVSADGAYDPKETQLLQLLNTLKEMSSPDFKGRGTDDF